MLTPEEKDLAKSATYFGRYWGKDYKEGPDMIVAEARGAPFKWEMFDGSLIALPGAHFHGVDVWSVLEEVMEWLGVNFSDYLNALVLEREAIFNRAQY